MSKPHAGSGGKILATIEPLANEKTEHALIEENNKHMFVLKEGELIALIPSNATDLLFATVIRSTSETALVSLQDAAHSLHAFHQSWKIIRLGGHVTFQRMFRGLELITEDLKPRRKARRRRGQRMDMNLLSVLLAPPESSCKPLFDQSVTLDSINFLADDLNPSQKEAVRHCMSAKQFALIHGPPGTGKSFVLVELIRQLKAQGKRILVCAASNAAVDNILEVTTKHNIPCVRLGRQEVHRRAHLNKFLLDSLIRIGATGSVIKQNTTKLNKFLNALSATKNHSRIQSLKESIDELSQELKDMEKLAAESILQDATVVFSTLSGTGGRLFRKARFDVVIIDEAAQTLEPDCLLAISRASKLIMAGDHHQLTPLVHSGMQLATSLFKRLLDNNPDSSRMLKVQYRMHATIMRYVSETLYNNELVAHESVINRNIKCMKSARDSVFKSPLFFIDTTGSIAGEDVDPETFSISNSHEVDLVFKHVKKLVRGGVKDRKIAVISPYKDQVKLLQAKIGSKFSKVEIGTVDGFQGREKEAVILSFVRSNPQNAIGFLDNYRRLNVAITRARSHLCIVGDGSTIFNPSGHEKKVEKPEFLQDYGAYLKANAKDPRQSLSHQKYRSHASTPTTRK
ncbi:hypothetical protein DSO57_1039715 [Entomophthora muscae]|uniref:Uncharacterized protein n=1 Tax=Entomophthora muscae TaxID=34485 RepID=A0ACC2UJN3_9FUNG|nr:hypothetical protein DSO57_1039715 [Entomophthora muscae]